MTRRLILWLPFALVFGLLALFWIGLSQPGEKVIQSNVVGQRLPSFQTVAALPGLAPVADSDFDAGKPRLHDVLAACSDTPGPALPGGGKRVAKNAARRSKAGRARCSTRSITSSRPASSTSKPLSSDAVMPTAISSDDR